MQHPLLSRGLAHLGGPRLSTLPRTLCASTRTLDAFRVPKESHGTLAIKALIQPPLMQMLASESNWKHNVR